MAPSGLRRLLHPKHPSTSRYRVSHSLTRGVGRDIRHPSHRISRFGPSSHPSWERPGRRRRRAYGDSRRNYRSKGILRSLCLRGTLHSKGRINFLWSSCTESHRQQDGTVIRPVGLEEQGGLLLRFRTGPLSPSPSSGFGGVRRSSSTI